MFRKVFLPIILVAVFIGVVGYFFGAKSPLGKGAAVVPLLLKGSEVKVAGKTIAVEVADSDEKRRQGLSGKTSLGESNGMLFIFEPASNPNFWMKNMNFAIDIIWIREGKIIRIDKSVPPEPNVPDSDLKLYYSPGEIDHVLEVNADYSNKNGLMIGDTVEYSL